MAKAELSHPMKLPDVVLTLTGEEAARLLSLIMRVSDDLTDEIFEALDDAGVIADSDSDWYYGTNKLSINALSFY